MLMTALPAASPLAQAFESSTAECCSTQAGLLLLALSMATVVTPAALTAPIPRARAQRGTRSNMVMALPFVLHRPDPSVWRCRIEPFWCCGAVLRLARSAD